MRARAAIAALLLSASACQRQPQQAKDAATPPPAAQLSPAVEEAKSLIDQGQLDAALERLQQAPAEADGLYLQGVVWSKKAETAPLPTPPPAPSPLPKGAEPPPAPEFKPEELAALDLYGKALAAKPDHALAHLAIAELLAPHAARQYDREEAAKKHPPGRRGKTPEPTPATAPGPGPDASPERVVREYQAARQADPRSAAQALDRLIAFAIRVGRPDDADAAFKETVKGVEKADPYVRYADFLANEKKDPNAAIDQYKQALVWRPDDDATRAKIADIYIAMGMEHYAAQQYSIAEARFKEAKKWVTDKSSPQGQKVQEYLGRLDALRAPH